MRGYKPTEKNERAEADRKREIRKTFWTAFPEYMQIHQR